MTSTAGTNAEAAGSPAVEVNQEQNISQDLPLDRGPLLDQGPQEVKTISKHFAWKLFAGLCHTLNEDIKVQAAAETVTISAQMVEAAR